MPRIVFCVVLKREAEGLDIPPYPGDLGQRIYENVSREAWGQWITRLTTLLSSFRLNTADPESVAFVEQHMLNFFFGEGDPAAINFRPPGGKK